MKEILEQVIREVIVDLGLPEVSFVVERPADMAHGDYATNVAMALSKAAKQNPRALAEKITEALGAKNVEFVSAISMAGPGFINFTLSPAYFEKEIAQALSCGDTYGHSTQRQGEHVLIEYTDPNPFKPLHIGHLMSNAIGESLSRLIEAQGARVTRACYQGDVGLHVAKALWGMQKDRAAMPSEEAPLAEKTEWLGKVYVAGATAYDENEEAKKEIVVLNKKIFELADPDLIVLYDAGRRWSLEHFEEAYATLGTKFDRYFFEREVASEGVAIVRAGQARGIFEESEGAIVYRGEQDGLHTRVFINRDGLPTYEAKELGLTKKKFEVENPDVSVVVTASEQTDYFRVVLAAMARVLPDAARKTKHVAHGMMRFSSGKMSSRKGNVITAHALLQETQEAIYAKLVDREYPEAEKRLIACDVGVASLKYSILRQAPGGDIIYDFEKSISLEGDSGPYLQYALMRTRAIQEKALGEGVEASAVRPAGENLSIVERLISRFPEVLRRGSVDLAPHHVAGYLIELAGAYNAYYAQQKIVDPSDPASAYRVALTQAVRIVLANGLFVLGVKIPTRM